MFRHLTQRDIEAEQIDYDDTISLVAWGIEHSTGDNYFMWPRLLSSRLV